MTSPLQRSHPTLDSLVLIAAATALHVMLARNNPILLAGGLVDTDAYMRLVRVRELWLGGDWYQTVTPALGAPAGLSLHWTRPLDVLILAPALLLHLFGLGIDRAIHGVGVAIAPLLHLAACFAAAWAARPLWPRNDAWRLAALMLLLNGAALTYSLAGRPDHHALGLLLGALGAGQIIRAMLAPRSARPAYWAGFWAGAAIWVSPESLVTIGPVFVALGLLWLGAENGREWLGLGRRMALGMAATVALAIVVEHPPGQWLAVEYDKVSWLHLAIALTIAIDFRLAETVAWAGWRRWLAGIGLAVLSALLLAHFFPRFYLGPMGTIDDPTARAFLDNVSEMRPLWPTTEESARLFFVFVGNSLGAALVLAYALRRWRSDDRFAPGLFLSLTFAVLLLGALLHARLAAPLGVFGAILGCGLFGVICGLADGKGPTVALLTRLSACMLVTFGFQAIAFTLDGDQAAKAGGAKSCDAKPVAEWLNEAHPAMAPQMVGRHDPSAPIVLTESINYTPQLAYHTDYRFVGGPYHRGVADIADMFAAMAGSDDAASRAVIARRQARFVLICITEVPKAISESAPDSLYHRLFRGALPGWLKPVEMSPAAGREFRLFSVVP